MKRRTFIAYGAGMVGTSVLAQTTQDASDKAVSSGPSALGKLLKPAELPKAKGPRVVVVGGGWSGLTMAKYLKRNQPKFDVVLIDRNPSFVSCPMSNLWLADQVDLEFLSHSYFDAARRNNYLFLQASAIDLDRDKKQLFTDQGYLNYDYLVVAPGIDYDYSRIGLSSPEEEHFIRTRYPAGFIQASEYLSIKRKIHEFKGGTFVLTVPAGNYRCMAAPYERACMVASVFKKRGIRAKILLLDANPEIRIKKDGFTQAYEQFYSDMIEYQPSVEIASCNLEGKALETDFDTYAFDDAVIYPPVRASRLIEQLGLMDPFSLQKEADIDPFKYHLMHDPFVYVTGDSRSQPFSKSANTSYTEARYVAEVIAAHFEGKEIEWRSPQTMCFSGVRIDPLEAMSIIAFYKYNADDQAFAFDRAHPIETWSDRSGQAALAWAEGVYRDLFYS